MLLMSMLVKVADVSHPCKQWDVHVMWSERISSEFFNQGDREVEMGLPISPLCDRSKHFLPKSQIDFVDYVVRPCVEVFSDYCKTSTWKDSMNKNYGTWKKMYMQKVLKDPPENILQNGGQQGKKKVRQRDRKERVTSETAKSQ